ncbi:alpha-2-macroglobulin family protein [Aureivirga sp. CE67]|uniref:alpha-2-macroglobulin family protein n=1 Tax=Aureivirga sp. CE67 TaxID=1788983 RepID=UPI0018C9A23A|nr:alpha-2-macroglobulin family protein [Aureivirga sp. CE67]
MKIKLLLFTMLVFNISFCVAQKYDYSKLWQEYESFKEQEMPKSALKISDKIIRKSKRKKDTLNYLKAKLDRINLIQQTSEDGTRAIIDYLRQEIDDNRDLYKLMFQLELATVYSDYIKANKFYLSKAPDEVTENSEDFSKWNYNRFEKEIDKLLSEIKSNKDLLLKFSLQDFKIIYDGNLNDDLTKLSLYDFYFFTYIENSKRNNDRSNRETISLEEFLKSEYKNPVFQLYQDILSHHQTNNNDFALVFWNLERLKYSNDYWRNEDELLDVLMHLYKQNKNIESSGLILLEIAEIALTREDIDPFEEKPKWTKLYISNLCKDYIEKYPTASKMEKLSEAISEFSKPFLEIKTKEFIPSNSPSKLFVTYNSIDTVFYKIYKLKDFKKPIEKLEESELNLIVQKECKILKNDLEKHTTEFLIPTLDYGKYCISVSDTRDFKNSISNYFTVTDLFLNVYRDPSEVYTFQISDRKTGKPIEDCEVKFYNNRVYTYDKKINRDSIKSVRIIKDTILKTNEKGAFVYVNKTGLKKDYLRILSSIEIANGEETLTIENFSLNNYVEKSEAEKEAEIERIGFIHVFTDRRIYRPNQKIYFKGIAYYIESAENTVSKKVIKNRHFVAYLLDKNRRKIAELKLKSNDFGSINGEFLLPQNIATGRFEIEIEDDYDVEEDEEFWDEFLDDIETEPYDFHVEEYKRKKTIIDFLSNKDISRFNDTITIKGKVSNFAGNALSNTKVSYVLEESGYSEMGTHDKRTMDSVRTNAFGEFEIKFFSENKLKIEKIYYKLKVEVSDLNGETVEANFRKKISEIPFDFKIKTSDVFIKEKNNSRIEVGLFNADRNEIKGQGKIRVYKKKTKENNLISGYWTNDYETSNYFKKNYFADAPVLSEEEHRALFPYLNYGFMDEESQKGAFIKEISFDTEISSFVELGALLDWKNGEYILEFESENYKGYVAKMTKEIKVLNLGSDEKINNNFFDFNIIEKEVEEGEDIILKLSSGLENFYLNFHVNQIDTPEDIRVIHLSNESKTVRIPTEIIGKTRSVFIDYYWVYKGCYQHKTVKVLVKTQKNEKLKFKTITFRDKIKPGEKQKWSFQIVNSKNKFPKVEVMASMYDQSLDYLDDYLDNYWTDELIKYARRDYEEDFSYHFNESSLYTPCYSIRNNLLNYIQKERIELAKKDSKRNLELLQKRKKEKSKDNFITVTGTVSDRDGALPIASVIIKGTNIGTETDFDGNYSIEAIPGDILVFSYVGYNDEEVVVSDLYTVLNVELKSGNVLEELSLGYVKKKTIDTIQNRNSPELKIRKNFQETAFFYPELKTDQNGIVSIEFDAPEGLTKWCLQMFAHTEEMKYGLNYLDVVTQKNLMVFPNPPRFFREKDTVEFRTKISSLHDKKLKGKVKLELFNGITGESIDKLAGNTELEKDFYLEKNGNTFKSWKFNIPEGVEIIRYRIIANTPEFSDGEQNELLVLSNRKLVTEPLPIWVNGKDTKTFTLEKLKETNSDTRTNYQLMVDVNSNPIWEAIQTLPYLMNYQYNCSEQTFSKLYANLLATHLFEENPEIKSIFKQWENIEGLKSNLDKNKNLKSILLEESPWLNKARTEKEWKQDIGKLLDSTSLKTARLGYIERLKKLQNHHGGFGWFSKEMISPKITLHIAIGLEQLKKIGVELADEEISFLYDSKSFVDLEIRELYNKIQKNEDKKDIYYDKDFVISYLYLKSFNTAIDENNKKELHYFSSLFKKSWMKLNLGSQAKLALYFNRIGEEQTAKTILKSLKERSISNEELGIYWKSNGSSWYWYQSSIETQCLLLEAFYEIDKDSKFVNGIKQWLLKRKQTNNWETTKATTRAIYALMLTNYDWIKSERSMVLKVGQEKIKPTKGNIEELEAKIGYIKKSWFKNEIKPEMAEVTIKKKDEGIAWGGLYWQYFEDLDKIETAETGLSVQKELFLNKNTSEGNKFVKITKDTPIKVGDLVTIRIILKTDRDIDFVHMKDMRASGFEPVDVISEYKWQGGLGYYQSTKDASTNFFFSLIRKGNYVLEYNVRANNAGQFSSGITTIQSMYAPEFSSHTKGVRVEIK